MEIEQVENAKPSSTDIEPHEENSDPQITNHVDKEPKCDISAEDARSIIEVMATTGKFWHDWDMLKIMLSARLKQVLSEYPESQMVSGDGPQQTSLAGQTYQDTVRRLDEALLGFIEGPPFTLQRLCEILLTPKSTYKSLSKLALALEKNLLVTSTLTLCTDPYPTAPVQKPEEPEPFPTAPVQKPEEFPIAPVQKLEPPDLSPTPPVQKSEEAVIKSEQPTNVSNTDSNGVETAAGDVDEEMTDAEADPEPEPEQEPELEQYEDAMNTDTEMREEKPSETPESEAKTNLEGDPSKEP